MFKKLLSRGKSLVFSQQSSILSAATLIMVMVVVSKVLGFIRQRVLFTYFTPQETDLFFAAFELPDLLFEILVFGIVSAAFIPVFSGYLSKKQRVKAWYMASKSLNLILFVFVSLGFFVFIFAPFLYNLLVGGSFKTLLGIEGGFSRSEIEKVVMLSRVLLIAQVIFVVSTFMTGILESHKRFILPAVAPLLYNLGIILGTIFLSAPFGLLGPTFGALIGAILHFAVQAPLAYYLGFRFTPGLDIKNEGVRRLLSLSAPRVIELSVFQIKRFVWLFLGSLTAGGFTYLKSAELLHTLPLSVFGVSLAKAALPTLSLQAGRKDMKSFNKTFFATFNQILFLVVPLSIFMIVLRIPMVRLVFGANRFDWLATLETSYTLSAFAVGTFAYGASLLANRAFYALHDTKTPVVVSIFSVFVNAILGFTFVLGFRTGTWGIALAYSFAGILQSMILVRLLVARLSMPFSKVSIPFVKIFFAASVAGVSMRGLLRFFDRSVWVKGLSFFSGLEVKDTIPYESFVIDTRYSGNLLFLTGVVFFVGGGVYFLILMMLKSDEVWAFITFAKRIINKKITPIPAKESEQISPSHSDSNTG